MNSLFLAHGSPMMAIETNEYTRFLHRLGTQYHPQAIVLFTAHWESEVLTISSRDDTYETIYDFYGFPEQLYEKTYPARGSQETAGCLHTLLEQNGIQVRVDNKRGLDHGSWVLLSHMYPAANIPVVQVSVHPFLPPSEQYRIGEAIRSVTADNVLVIGSGVTVHNLRSLNWEQKEPEPWAEAFDDWLIQHIKQSDLHELFRYHELAPHASMAVPRPEHLVPFFIAMGSGDPAAPAEILYRSYDFGTLSYLCFGF